MQPAVLGSRWVNVEREATLVAGLVDGQVLHMFSTVWVLNCLALSSQPCTYRKSEAARGISLRIKNLFPTDVSSGSKLPSHSDADNCREYLLLF